MKNFKKAFSLMELSIVILIIGIIIGGLTQSASILQHYRIKTARALTQSSPVPGITRLVYWFEPTLETSFKKSDAIDQTVISQWNDNSPQNAPKLNAYAGQKTDSSKVSYNMAPGGTAGNTSGPTYIEDGIGNLPTLRFTNNASSAYRYLVVDRNMKTGPDEDITFFVVVNYRSGNDFFLDRACLDASGTPVGACASAVDQGNPLLEPSLSGGSLVIYTRPDSGTPLTLLTTNYTMPVNKPLILTFERKVGTAFNVYVNGNSSFGGTSTFADPGGTISLSPTKIGRHNINDTGNVDIDISELILYSGPLQIDDRQAVEDYLGKKYRITVTH